MTRGQGPRGAGSLEGRAQGVGTGRRIRCTSSPGRRLPANTGRRLTVHPWKKALPDGAADIFEPGGKTAPEADGDTVRALLAKIGELAVANDFCHESSSPGPAREAGR